MILLHMAVCFHHVSSLFNSKDCKHGKKEKKKMVKMESLIGLDSSIDIYYT